MVKRFQILPGISILLLFPRIFRIRQWFFGKIIQETKMEIFLLNGCILAETYSGRKKVFRLPPIILTLSIILIVLTAKEMYISLTWLKPMNLDQVIILFCRRLMSMANSWEILMEP